MRYTQMMDERRKAAVFALDDGTAPGAAPSPPTTGNDVAQGNRQSDTAAAGS